MHWCPPGQWWECVDDFCCGHRSERAKGSDTPSPPERAILHPLTCDLLMAIAESKWNYGGDRLAEAVRAWQKAGCPNSDSEAAINAERDRKAGFDLVRIFAKIPELDASVSIRRFNNGFAVKSGEGWGSSYRAIARGKADTMYEAIATARRILYDQRSDEEGEGKD